MIARRGKDRTFVWLVLALAFAAAALAVVPGALGAQGGADAGETAEERANVELVRRYFDELHTEGDLVTAEEVVAADAVFHIPGAELTGPEGISGLVTLLHTAFPDVEFPMEDVVAEGDKVVVRWTMRGTSEAEFQGIPPTGEAVEMTGIGYLTVADGMIVENWIEYDLYGLLQQLGAIPEPEPAA